MEFKYCEYLSKLSNCPPGSYAAQELKAFRFVFEDLDDERNFLPVLLINPKRANSINDVCSGYAISLFDSVENARKRYLQLKKIVKNINRALGTHIAEGDIDENDGVVSEISHNGHFDLHEFASTDLRDKFSIVTEVCYNGIN